VLTVPVYRWELPEDVEPVRRLIADVVRAEVDAVTFTSAPAAAGLLQIADDAGQREALVDTLRERVLAVAVGPVTAAPLEAAGIPTRQPERARLAALAREVVARLVERDPVRTPSGDQAR
jgi:uroporphyrinogen-III synthase